MFWHLSSQGVHEFREIDKTSALLVEGVEDVAAFDVCYVYALVLDDLFELVQSEQIITIGICILKTFLEQQVATGTFRG